MSAGDGAMFLNAPNRTRPDVIIWEQKQQERVSSAKDWQRVDGYMQKAMTEVH
jgi:hypothetical protein